MAKIIAVANQKGGVGKTTTCVNLTAALHALGERVLLCDMDPQGHSGLSFGINKHGDNLTVYDIIVNSARTSDVIKKTPYGDILPSSTNLAAAEIELAPLEHRHFILRKALGGVRDNYDYIIIDCPPSLGMLTINSLCAADSVLVPVDCGFLALDGLSALTNTMSAIRKGLNPSLEIEGVLLTMFDSRTNLSVQIAQEIKRFFPKKVFSVTIPRNIRLAEAPSHGKPVMEYDKYSRGAECYTRLAEEIAENNKEGL